MSCLPNLAELYHEPNQNNNFHSNNKKNPDQSELNLRVKKLIEREKHELNTISDPMQ